MNNNGFKRIKGIKIDPKIFSYKFNCKCTGECCHYGVYTDLKEYEKIIAVKDDLLSVFDQSQTGNIEDWFEPAEEDKDFESCVAVGTNIFNNKCAFLDKNNLCSLQKFANSKKENKWKYKPLYCILFPLTIYEGILTVDDEHIDRLKTCNKQENPKTSIFEACREELVHFFGEKGFEELENYKKDILNEIKIGETANVKG